MTSPNGNPNEQAGTATSQTATGASGAALTDPEFKFKAGAGVPEWAVGKTAQEILGLAQRQNEIIAQMPTYQPPAKTEQRDKPWDSAVAGQGANLALPTDDEWVATPQKAFEKALEANVATRFAPMLEGLAAGVAQSARAQSVMAFPDVFKRFGPEIDNEVARVPVGARTVDLYRYAVDIVRGRHVDELAEERLQQRLAGLPAAERAMGGATGGAPVGGLIDWDKLSPTVREKWQRAGITEATIREDCAKWGLTPEKFLEMTLNKQLISETPDGGWTVSAEALKIPAGGMR